MEGEQAPKFEEEPNIIESLKDAIQNRDMIAAAQYLTELDSYLVGDGGLFQLKQQPDFEAFVMDRVNSCKIYLGDGGTSRLIMSREGDNLHLEISEYNSSDSVKEHWKALAGSAPREL